MIFTPLLSILSLLYDIMKKKKELKTHAINSVPQIFRNIETSNDP